MYHVMIKYFDDAEPRSLGKFGSEEAAEAALVKFREELGEEEGKYYFVEPDYRWLAEQKYHDEWYDPDHDFDNDAEYD